MNLQPNWNKLQWTENDTPTKSLKKDTRMLQIERTEMISIHHWISIFIFILKNVIDISMGLFVSFMYLRKLLFAVQTFGILNGICMSWHVIIIIYLVDILHKGDNISKNLWYVVIKVTVQSSNR